MEQMFSTVKMTYSQHNKHYYTGHVCRVNKDMICESVDIILNLWWHSGN